MVLVDNATIIGMTYYQLSVLFGGAIYAILFIYFVLILILIFMKIPIKLILIVTFPFLLLGIISGFGGMTIILLAVGLIIVMEMIAIFLNMGSNY